MQLENADSIVLGGKSCDVGKILQIVLEITIAELTLLDVAGVVVEVGVIASDDSDADCARELCCNHRFQRMHVPVISSRFLFSDRMKLVFRALRRTAHIYAAPQMTPDHALSRSTYHGVNRRVRCKPPHRERSVKVLSSYHWVKLRGGIMECPSVSNGAKSKAL
jgi:hypothetical protein